MTLMAACIYALFAIWLGQISFRAVGWVFAKPVVMIAPHQETVISRKADRL